MSLCHTSLTLAQETTNLNIFNHAPSTTLNSQSLTSTCHTQKQHALRHARTISDVTLSITLAINISHALATFYEHWPKNNEPQDL